MVGFCQKALLNVCPIIFSATGVICVCHGLCSSSLVCSEFSHACPRAIMHCLCIYMMLRRWLCAVSAISCPTCDDSSFGEILLYCSPPLRVLVMITVIFGLLSVCPSPFAFMLQCRGQFIRIPNEVTVPALFCWGVIPAAFFLLYGCTYISDVRMRHPPLITKGMSPSRYVLHHCCL